MQVLFFWEGMWMRRKIFASNFLLGNLLPIPKHYSSSSSTSPSARSSSIWFSRSSPSPRLSKTAKKSDKFFLPATSLPPLRKNGSNIGEDLTIFLVYFLNGTWKWGPLFPVFFWDPSLLYSLSWQGLWVAFSSRLYSCLRRYISKGEKSIDIDIHLSLKHCQFAEFFVPPIPERTNCNFKGTQWGEHISHICHYLTTKRPRNLALKNV